MRRLLAFQLGAVALFGLLAPGAGAAPPTIGPVSATNIQGVSALLLGTVDPGGLPTTYSFQYVEESQFEASGFAGASSTPPMPLSGAGAHPARAAIGGLQPDTAYRFRLSAHNEDGDTVGSPAAFTTSSGFGFLPGSEGFAVSAVAEGGDAASVAGSHPYRLSLDLGLKLGGEFEGQPGAPFADGDLRNLRLGLPPGLVLNPAALPKCRQSDFHAPRTSPFEASRSGESCPDNTQIGTVEVKTSLGGGETRRFGVFNLVPPPGAAAEIGFAPYGAPIVLDVRLRQAADGSYALDLSAADFPQRLNLYGLELVLWGIPWAISHNGERGNCLNQLEPTFPWAKCSVGAPRFFPPKAYLTLPGFCPDPLAFTVAANAWQQPAQVSASALNRDRESGDAVQMQCAELGFESHPEALLTTSNASTASGFRFELQNEADGLLDPDLRAPSQVRDATVVLPEGVSINPSLGEGLGVCTPAQYAAESPFSLQGEACPNAAKIGELTVRTPLFDEWFEGAVYLAQPDDPATPAPGAENPFDSLVALYLVGKAPVRGVQVAVAGEIVPNPRTGRLTARFEGLPQLPYDDLEVSLRSGQRAPLISPPACGPHTTVTELVPWGGDVPFTRTETKTHVVAGIGAGPCPAGTPPFAPGAVAGGVNSNVGSYTPYFVHLSREDTEQEITSYSVVLPKGITGKLAGIPYCPEAAIAAARVRRGTAESADPSCPAASQVGRTLTGYGVGPALTYAPGRIYLAGPYKGSPLSLVTVNSATVGPFDLGTIVIRSAFDVDPITAQLRIDSSASDPIPHILGGIPLHLRDVRIYIDRPEFTRNPTSCEPSQLESTLTGAGARFDDPSDDSSATVAVRFQLLNCLTLGFRPKLGLRLRGGTRRGDYPSLRATFAARPQDANLRRIAVTMPHALFLAQNHIRTVCTREQFAAERCPPGSVYGRAVARTPLFDGPLTGSVYLRSSDNELPDLVTSLRYEEVRIVLSGRIGPSEKGGIRAFFDELPDAPIERFTMILGGGRRGLLVNSLDICASPPRATIKGLAQNNLGRVFTSKLRGRCGKGNGRKHDDKRGKR